MRRHGQPLSGRPRLARRRSERGQALPIIAVMATLLCGVAALATDLSINTHYRRNLQNVSDAAALAGATRLQTNPVTQANRIKGAIDAFAVMYDRLHFPITGASSNSYFTDLVNDACWSSSTHCTVMLSAGAYAMTVATPPVGAGTAAYNGVSQNFETKVVQTSNNGLAGILGQSTTKEGGHSVAYHSTPHTTFGFALYADQYVSSGNAAEVITGNVYAAQYLAPQSSGQASICAQGGGIVLGSPQDPNEPGGYDTQATHVPMPPGARQVTLLSDCSGASGGQVAQTLAEGCTMPNVTSSSTWYVDDPGYSQTVPSGITVGNTHACVANPGINPPTLTGPPLPQSPPVYNCTAGNTGLVGSSYQPGRYTCPLVVDHPLAPGMYQIQHQHGSAGPDVTISQTVPTSCSASETTNGFNVCLDGVTFYGEMNSWAEAPSLSVTSKVSVNQTPACSSPPANQFDCVYPIYAALGVPFAITTSNLNTIYALQGTLYMPGGTMTIGQNSRVTIQGQAIVQQWNDQSGAHPDPSITWNGAAVAPLQEQLRLLE
jgi:Flp pilus assembly protein TadG